MKFTLKSLLLSLSFKQSTAFLLSLNIYVVRRDLKSNYNTGENNKTEQEDHSLLTPTLTQFLALSCTLSRYFSSVMTRFTVLASNPTSLASLMRTSVSMKIPSAKNV